MDEERVAHLIEDELSGLCTLLSAGRFHTECFHNEQMLLSYMAISDLILE